MSRAIPTARLVALASAAHLSFLEHRDRFAEAMAEFSASCFGPGAGIGPPGT